MSLVEKALRKLQAAQAAGGPGTANRRAVDSPADLEREVAAAEIAPARDAQAARPAPQSDVRVTINRAALRAAGLLPPEADERRLASEFRKIKRPIIAAALGKGVPKLADGRMIMVASALPGDGKTFTSVNLALSMALEKDISVLLVDADLAKPHLSRTFGVQGEPGLLDLLRDELRDPESVIIPTTVPGLSLVPAGHDSDTATELLASERMEQVVASLTNRDPSRIVLFDSPPLLLTSESRVLSGVVGQVVVVVSAGVTPQSAVAEALACLAEGKPVGIVLNRCESTPPGEYYGYGDYGDAQRTNG